MVVGPVQTNCYLIKNKENESKAVLIDPGDDAGRILDALKKQETEPVAILLTHGHFDHIEAVPAIKEAYPSCTLCIALAEKPMVEDPSLNADFLDGMLILPDRYLEDGDVLEYIGKQIRVISSPGHTAGSVCYYFEEDKVLFAGDTIFLGSCGRTDLPTGDEREMFRSLEMLLTTLPGDTVVYPGHGPSTTIERERMVEGFSL